MADIAAQLVWFRAMENYESLSDSYQRFSWSRVDVLDMLFLGWVAVSFAVVGLVNLYLRIFVRPKVLRRGSGGGGGGAVGCAGRSDTTGSSSSSSWSGGGLRGDGETAQWMNSVVGWFCENSGRRQALVEAWAKSLSEEAKKYSEPDVQIRFDGILSGSSHPKLSDISTDTQDKQTLTVLANVTCTDITLLVSVVTMTATHMQTTGCQIRISKLSGPMRIQWKSQESPDNLHLSFLSTPEINLCISPNNYGGNKDASLVQSVIRKTVSKVVLRLPFPGDGRAVETFSQTILDGRSRHDLRLLVKVVKANGLTDKDFASCDPYCTISVNEPPQQHSTSVVKNAANPFFDEYFLIDTNSKTKQMTFEVYDQSKPKGDDFLGQASVSIEDLRNKPSSRQIISLIGQVSSITSGSVTAEFLFVDSNESSWGKLTDLEQSPSRRRVEKSHLLMPGGIAATTLKTTMTERLRDQQENSLKLNESPTRAEKAETETNYAAVSSPHLSITSSPDRVCCLSSSTSQVKAKKKSFSSALKRRFTRNKKSRSLGAD